jgi:predicted ATP-dependent protease
MGYSARWVEHRKKLNSKFELIADVLSEAGSLVAAGTPEHPSNKITINDIKTVIQERRKRSARLEDRSHEDIESGQILIDTTGRSSGKSMLYLFCQWATTSMGCQIASVPAHTPVNWVLLTLNA